MLVQLPRGPVDELCVSAPFHDPGAVALAALVERLSPAQLTVAYQPGMTQLDGPALVDLLRRTEGRLVVDEEKRYRHGKLIEWSAGGRRWCVACSYV